MRRFLITSNKFTGTAELIYSNLLHLVCIDMRNAVMSPEVITAFKKAMPTVFSEEAIKAAISEGTTIVEADLIVTFKQFYDDYPLKRNRYKAEKIFNGMSKTDQVTAYYSLAGYKKYLAQHNWLNPMIADNYLRNHHFETDWSKV